MAISLSQRANFYHELGRLLEGGVPPLQALGTMLETTGPAEMTRILRQLHTSAGTGSRLADCLAQPGLPFGSMEISLMTACEHGGKIPLGCGWLADYFHRIAHTRRTIGKRAIYPLFLLHFGVLVLSLPKLLVEGGQFSLWTDILAPLTAFYALVATIWIGATILGRLAGTSIFCDRLLHLLPLVGGLRRNLTLHRFCACYHLQLDAGVDVLHCLESAAASAHSALLSAAVARALPHIREAGQVATHLAASGAFPTALTRAMLIGEQTGTVDREMARAAAGYETAALARIEALSEWLPRIIYLIIVLYLGWSVVTIFKQSMSGLEKMMEL